MCLTIGGINQPGGFEEMRRVASAQERSFIRCVLPFAPMDTIGSRSLRTEHLPEAVTDQLVLDLVDHLRDSRP